jgi:hypothetical protein
MAAFSVIFSPRALAKSGIIGLKIVSLPTPDSEEKFIYDKLIS